MECIWERDIRGVWCYLHVAFQDLLNSSRTISSVNSYIDCHVPDEPTRLTQTPKGDKIHYRIGNAR